MTLQLGWVYKDKRGFDVLITRPSGFESSKFTPDSLKFTFEGIVLGKERACGKYFTSKGLYSTDDNDEWACDLILESGKPWVATESTPSE